MCPQCTLYNKLENELQCVECLLPRPPNAKLIDPEAEAYRLRNETATGDGILYKLSDVVGYGLCFFITISKGLLARRCNAATFDYDQPSTVRGKIIGHMYDLDKAKVHWWKVAMNHAEYGIGAKTLAQYINTMLSGTGVEDMWGGPLEAMVATDLYEIDVVIHRSFEHWTGRSSVHQMQISDSSYEPHITLTSHWIL